MRKLLLKLLVVLASVGLCALAPTASTAPGRASECQTSARQPHNRQTLAAIKGLTDEQRQKNIESFELVWKTVRDSHYDPKLGGLDWQAVYRELRPRMEKARSMDEARSVLRDMLARLGHSHMGILPSSWYEDAPVAGAQETTAQERAVPGFDVRMIDEEAVVVRVCAGLPAAKAGVHPGWIVRKIDGEAIAPMLSRIRQTVKNSRHAGVEQASAVKERLVGAEGKEVRVAFLDAAGKEITVSIARARPKGNRVQVGNMPAVYVDFEARTLDKNVAYFHLSSFFDPMRVMKAFGATVQENLHSKGFILDLRGNPGGLIVMTQGLGGWFVKQPDLKLGTMIERQGSKHLFLNPRDVTLEGPLAILVDEFSKSSSEFLAGGLQDLKRARVFGRPTLGVALASAVIPLPNGDRLQYVTADYVSASGKRLEGHGVQPDEIVPMDRKALLEGHDPILEAALAWIGAVPSPGHESITRLAPRARR